MSRERCGLATPRGPGSSGGLVRTVQWRCEALRRRRSPAARRPRAGVARHAHDDARHRDHRERRRTTTAGRRCSRASAIRSGSRRSARVMGMDWHSSGITTSVMGALKRGLNPRAHELGIYICGGRGRHSRNTPGRTPRHRRPHGLDGEALVRTSRLTARIDNNAIADGFQIYLHAFVVTRGRRVGGRAAGHERGEPPGAPLSLALGRRARLHRRSAHRDRRRASPGTIRNLVDRRARGRRRMRC